MIAEMRKLGYSDEQIIKDFEGKLLEVKNIKLSIYFAGRISGANVRAHGQVIMDGKSEEYNAKFMQEVEGADIGAHVAAFNNIKIRSYKESLNDA